MRRKNNFVSILIFLLFCLLNIYFQKPAYADNCDGNLGDDGESCCYSGAGGSNLPCDGPSCVCNGSLVCTDESNINDPLNWVCRGAGTCGLENGLCCVTNDPTQKCQSGLACFRDSNGNRSCKECGVENGPCCVTGNACGVDLEPEGNVGNENCVCRTTVIPNPGTVTGTCSYTDPVTNEVIDGQCVLCNIVNNAWVCPCSGSLYDRNMANVTWNCVENNLTPQQEARCCIEAQPSPICGAQGREEHCSPLDDCPASDRLADPGVGCTSLEVCCKGFGPPVPKPPSLIYKGPVIENLEDIIGPVAAMLYYGGLAIGFFFIILSGYRLMTSEGDPQRVKGAQEQLTSAIIGIVFILLSVTIIRIIMDSILNI